MNSTVVTEPESMEVLGLSVWSLADSDAYEYLMGREDEAVEMEIGWEDAELARVDIGGQVFEDQLVEADVVEDYLLLRRHGFDAGWFRVQEAAWFRFVSVPMQMQVVRRAAAVRAPGSRRSGSAVRRARAPARPRPQRSSSAARAAA